MSKNSYICTAEMSNRFYLVRNALNKTQKEMGPALGYSQSLFSRIESPTTCKVEKKLILLMCAMYDVNYDYLVNGEGPMFNVDKQERRAWMHMYDALPEPYKDMILTMLTAFVEKGSNENKTPADSSAND